LKAQSFETCLLRENIKGKISGAVIKLASRGLIPTYIGQKMHDLQHDDARV